MRDVEMLIQRPNISLFSLTAGSRLFNTSKKYCRSAPIVHGAAPSTATADIASWPRRYLVVQDRQNVLPVREHWQAVTTTLTSTGMKHRVFGDDSKSTRRNNHLCIPLEGGDFDAQQLECVPIHRPVRYSIVGGDLHWIVVRIGD
jgi:hypothetical protein